MNINHPRITHPSPRITRPSPRITRPRNYCPRINCTYRIGFTLIELMVAVLVLLVVMVAVGRIFSTTSDVSASGQAISETLQQAVAIEQQLRKDILKISREGFLGIRSVALANNMKGDFLLIDDSLPPNAIIRCDQLIFFTDGIASPMIFTNTTDFAGQGLASMIYYGHGIRLEQLEGQNEGTNNFDESDDPVYFSTANPTVITPWFEGAIDVETRRYTDSKANRFDIVANSQYVANGTQQDPNQWIVARQEIVLGDDDQQNPDNKSKTVYMGKGISSNTIFPWDPRIGGLNIYPHVLQGRVDIAATQLDDIRQSVLQNIEGGGANNRNWRDVGNGDVDQQELIASLFYWPRVEPYPPTAIRYDQAMMMAALVEGCVSFQIEWMYDEGVGETTDANHNNYLGYGYDSNATQPWWGGSWRVDPLDDMNLEIGFDTLVTFTEDANSGFTNHTAAWSVDPWLIEPTFASDDGFIAARVPTVHNPTAGVSEYWAIFGYNGSEPFLENGLDFLNDSISGDTTMDIDGLQPGSSTWRYTPLPSALRITLRLLDRDNRLGAGWTYQFVVDLPERK